MTPRTSSHIRPIWLLLSALMALAFAASLPIAGCFDGALDCQSDADCFVGESCQDGSCTTAQDTNNNNGCPAERPTLCDGSCVDIAFDPLYCGSCEERCNLGEVCNVGTCDAVEDCRTEGCVGLSYCDQEDGKCKPGCSDDDACGEGSSCDQDLRRCTCGGGFHECRGVCRADDDVDHCLDRCEPCPDDPNGTPRCTEEGCTLDCEPGYAFCGGRCAPCPSAVGGTLICEGDACVVGSCNDGYELCQGACAVCPDADEVGCMGNRCVESSCGAGRKFCNSGCVECPNEVNGTAACDGSACVLNCQEGYRYCNQGCARCPTGNGVATTACDSDRCVVTECADGYKQCPMGCCSDAVSLPQPGAILSLQPPMDGFGTLSLSLALNGQGLPSVAYHDRGNRSLRMARWSGSQWQVADVETGLDETVEARPSMDFDSGGRPHIVYRDQPDAGLRHAWQTLAGDWRFERIDPTLNATRPSLAIDSSDRFHVSYHDLANDRLKYAIFENNTWSTRVVDAVEQTGSESSIALDSNNLPSISYSDLASYNLRFAKRIANTFDITTAFSQREVGVLSELVIDSIDRPRVVFAERVMGAFGGTIYNIYYGALGANGWSSTSLVSSPANASFLDNSSGTVGLAIDVDSRNRPRAFYSLSYPTANNMRGARMGLLSLSGNNWSEDSITPPSRNVSVVDMVIDPNDTAHAIYVSETQIFYWRKP